MALLCDPVGFGENCWSVCRFSALCASNRCSQSPSQCKTALSTVRDGSSGLSLRGEVATGACLAQQQPSDYSPFGDCSSAAAAIAIVIAKLLTSTATANAGTDHSRIHAKSSAGVSYFPGVLHVVHFRLGWWAPPAWG